MASKFTIIARRYGMGEIAHIDRFHTLEYTLVENEVGALVLTLPDTGAWHEALLLRDTTLEVYRTEGGVTNLEGDKVWFIRRIKRILNSAGEYLIQLTAYDARHLLKRRIVNYVSGSAQSRKVLLTMDNMMRAVVRENLGALAVPARRFVGLTVEADVAYPNGADTISKSFAWRNVFTVLQEIANQSANSAGTTGILRYLSFDIIRTGNETMEFKIFYDQRGTDRSVGTPSPAIFSPESGSLADASIEVMSDVEANVIIVGGPGEEAARLLTTVSNNEVFASAYNYIEAFADARNAGKTINELTSEGAQQLYAMRKRTVFTGNAAQTNQLRYGIHYKWGDTVTCYFRSFTAPRCIIQRVLVRVTPTQGETIDLGFLSEAVTI